MKTANYDEMPARMNDLWEWIVALDSWDYCDASLLCTLVENNVIPDEFKQPISDIVSGKRKQKKKAAAKLKISAADRMRVAGSVSAILGLIDVIKYSALDPSDDGAKAGAVAVGNYKAIEPIDIIREVEAEGRNAIVSTAAELNVSTETVENLLRDLRVKIKAWPNLSWNE
jgi:hypothetical protein